MKKLKTLIEKFYYKHFSEDIYDRDYQFTTHVDRMYQSLFITIMLRLFLAGVALYFISEVFYKETQYDTWQFLVSLLVGYLVTPLVVYFFIPKYKRKDYLVGAYTPIPLTLVWLLPKFL